MNFSRPMFVALIAAHNRPHLLAHRALPSVAAQTRQPDLLIIADDSEPKFRARHRRIAEEFARTKNMRVLHLPNKREKGASGAWNTGVLTALAEVANPGNAYLAVLDDDDEWAPAHLANAENVLRAANGRRVDLFAAAFNRRENARTFVVPPPQTLNGRDFLTGNPGVGGSTLIVRLSAFLRAGMFDEFLPACTDRDLFYRLSLLPNIVYKPLSEPSAIHYADDNRSRISNAQGGVKHEGLNRFADKYFGWMRITERVTFSRRAKKLFGWTLGKSSPLPAPPTASVFHKKKARISKDKIALVVGVIVPLHEKSNPLFADILELSKDRRLSSTDVIIVPSSGRNRREMRKEADKWRRAGLRIHCVSDIPTQLRKFFSPNILRGVRPIAVNRTILHHAVSHLAGMYKNPVCWILDGDNRLHGMKSSNRCPVLFRPDYIGEMFRLRDSGCDIAIGEINGSAPLPRAFTVRTQMTDLLHLLGRLQQSTSDRRPPRMTISSGCTAEIPKHYYHDCLPHPFLEYPAGFSPLPKTCSQSDVIRALPRLLNRILAGDAVTRPTLTRGDNALSERIHRGGNTMIFNAEVLRECPNGLARILPRMRRQDEVWRIFSESSFGRKIVAGNFPITQSRETDSPQAPDMNRIAEDTIGHAVSIALRNIIDGQKFSCAQSTADFLLRNQTAFCDSVRHIAKERLLMIRASFFRICGTADSMRGIIEQSGGCNRDCQNAVHALQEITRCFADDKVRELERRIIRRLNEKILLGALSEFPNDCRDFAAMQEAWAIQIKRERKENARALLEHSGTIEKPLRFLGQGNEGTVFASGGSVFKVLHRWYSRTGTPDPGFFPPEAQKWQEVEALGPGLRVWNNSGDLVLKTPYEKTAPYKGGYGAGMVALLADMRQRGIVFWNIAPKNLRRKGEAVRMIDYGRGVHPFAEKEFDLSVRKAWLCWRWAFRNDLPALLTASLRNRNMPELDGYETMKTAAEQFAARYRSADTTVAKVLRKPPQRLLDYGCGKGQDAILFAKRGIDATAFDTTLTAKTRARLIAAGVKVADTCADLDASGPYDMILLRHVLCEIRSDKELRQCLSRIRRLLSPRGRALVTACDSGEPVKDTPFAKNIFPRGANFNRKFFYRKIIRASNSVRTHVHRPEAVLSREFARAGLRIVSRNSFPDIDLARFETCGGALQWELAPLPERPETALIIRACAMDAEDAEAQILRLSERLNFPRGFSEIILAVDARTDDFTRQHSGGDLSALLHTARQLRRDGWIDRIIVAPPEAREIQRINRKWLGLDCKHSHAANGAPLSVSLAAMEKCRTRFALHIDIDMFVGRINSRRDFLGMMLRTMESRNALTMALNIPGAISPLKQNRENPFRLEVRSGLTDIGQMKKMLPLPARATVEGVPESGWHRAADILIKKQKLVSLRGGTQGLFVLHPPNCFKTCKDARDIADNASRRGIFPSSQSGKNEWNGNTEEWLPPPRREQFIFVICGRSVPGGKINRCLNSLARQNVNGWGAVIMDDASDFASSARLQRWANARQERVTYFTRRLAVGGLANLVFAVRHLCADPESVIITLDMDDSLAVNNVVETLKREYDRGADVSVGSMLRSDKQAHYPVCFDNPRDNRGGNVWQHLRSFKKRLFDAIPDSALRDDNGEYFHLAEDWAYMLPIVETAARPVWIKDILYFYEPDTRRKKAIREAREEAIARIVRRPAFLPARRGRKK